MRILAFSDLHCGRKYAENIVTESANADVVVGAGDFGIRGERSTELFDILRDITAPLLIVSGNHDRLSDLTAYCATKRNTYLLNGRSLTLKGIVFLGLGGEIPSRSDASWNESIEEDLAAKILLAAPPPHVLITHTPPFGYCDLQKNGMHEGSEAIYGAIKKHSPSLCLCGHIHHSWGSIQTLEKTTVHNLGPNACWYTIDK